MQEQYYFLTKKADRSKLAEISVDFRNCVKNQFLIGIILILEFTQDQTILIID